MRQQPVHFCYGVLHRADDIFHEKRIVAVSGGIGYHERLLGDEVLKIMNNVSRQAVKRLKLPRLDQRLRGGMLGEMTGRLTSGGLEKVAVFPVKMAMLRIGTGKHHKPQQVVVQYQRRYQPGIGYNAQPGGHFEFSKTTCWGLW